MVMESYETPKHGSPFTGFATASGKAVTVSEGAMKKAKILWDDIKVEEEPMFGNEEPQCTPTLKTTSNVPLEDLNDKHNCGKFEDAEEPMSESPNGEFTIEEGKPIDASDEALNNEWSPWSDEELARRMEPKFHGGFTTAGGKSVIVSAEALKKAKNFWKDEEFADEMKPLKKEKSDHANGFALQKPEVDVSEKTQLEVKIKKYDEYEDGRSINVGLAGGFTTAGGKPVSVSKDALKKARSLWNDEDFDFSETHMDVASDENPASLSEQLGPKIEEHVGFATAGGNPVKISEEALKVAKKHWNDFDKGEETSSKIHVQHGHGGFSTAGGKPVSVSDEALKKAKSLWSDENFDFGDTAMDVKSCDNFSKTNGNSVNVSMDLTDLKSARDLKNDTVPKSDSSITVSSKQNTSTCTLNKPVPAILGNIKKKSRGFITPFRTDARAVQADSESNSSKNTPVLQSRQPGLVRSSGSAKGLGTSLDRRVGSAESLKRSRCSLGDIGNSSDSCSKAPKTSSISSPSGLNLPSVNDSTHSSVQPISISNCNVTDSQMTEVLESSKALLDDDEFDDTLNEGSMVTNLEPDITKPVSMASLTLDKNPVHLIRALIARSYPITYCCKTPEGKIEYLSQTAFEKLESSRESSRQAEMEKMFSQIQLERQNSLQTKAQVPLRSLRKGNLESLSINELLHIVESGDDFGDIRPLLSIQKLAQLREAQEKKREEDMRDIQKEVESRMKNLVCGFSTVTAVKKIRLVDLTDLKKYRETVLQGHRVSLPRHALLSLWRPSDDWQTNLVEGIAIEISGSVPSQISHDEVKLNSGRGTGIRPLPKQSQQYPCDKDCSQFTRNCSSFDDILNSTNFHPPFGEFDIVGLIIQIESPTAKMGETIYISDQCTNILSIKFWKSILIEGLTGVIQVGNLIAVNNIQWRESSRNEKIPTGYVQETTRFSLRPNEIYLKEALERLKNQIVDIRSQVSAGEERVYSILNDLEEDDDLEKTPPLKRHIQPYFQVDPTVKKNLMQDFM